MLSLTDKTPPWLTDVHVSKSRSHTSVPGVSQCNDEDDPTFQDIFGSDISDGEGEGGSEKVMIEEEKKELVSIEEEFQRATALPRSSTETASSERETDSVHATHASPSSPQPPLVS